MTKRRRSAQWVLENVRGTVQADILKEDQGQNTCIFSTEFSLKVMGDIQEYFVHHDVRNFYSVIDLAAITSPKRAPIRSASSRSRCRTASRSSRRISRAAWTSTTSRRTCRFFFSNGMDPEYSVLGRVARRIWAVAMKRPLRRERAQPEAQVPLPDQRPQPARAGNRVQRHPHHAAGADRHLRQREQPAHQRVRRGDHHAHRRVGAPRDGDPAGHQP